MRKWVRAMGVSSHDKRRASPIGRAPINGVVGNCGVVSGNATNQALQWHDMRNLVTLNGNSQLT